MPRPPSNPAHLAAEALPLAVDNVVPLPKLSERVAAAPPGKQFAVVVEELELAIDSIADAHDAVTRVEQRLVVESGHATRDRAALLLGQEAAVARLGAIEEHLSLEARTAYEVRGYLAQALLSNAELLRELQAGQHELKKLAQQALDRSTGAEHTARAGLLAVRVHEQMDQVRHLQIIARLDRKADEQAVVAVAQRADSLEGQLAVAGLDAQAKRARLDSLSEVQNQHGVLLVWVQRQLSWRGLFKVVAFVVVMALVRHFSGGK